MKFKLFTAGILLMTQAVASPNINSNTNNKEKSWQRLQAKPAIANHQFGGYDKNNYTTLNNNRPVMLEKPIDNKFKSTKFGKTETNLKSTTDACGGYSALSTMGGEQLFNFMQSTDFNCISLLYNADSVAVDVYQQAKVIDVANRTATIATSYDTTTGMALRNLFYFLRGAFYVEFYNDDLTYSSDSAKLAVRAALQAFSQNSLLLSNNNTHAMTLQEYFTSLGSSDSFFDAIAPITNYLNIFDSTYLNSSAHRAALTSALSTLFYGYYDDAYTQAAEQHSALRAALLKVARSAYIYNSPYSYQTFDAFGEYARFYDYQQRWSLSTALKTELNTGTVNFMNDYGQQSDPWFKAASYLDYYNPNQCSQFNICHWKTQLETIKLGNQYTCSNSITIKAESITAAQATQVCNELIAQESLFHTVFPTNNTPVADDNNQNLEINIFANSQSYRNWAGELFGISTNNGGMYLEGNPADSNNQARFIAFVADWITTDYQVWNLIHEYNHYLDGRFNFYGAFADYRINDGKTVWWIEGIAEYLTYQNDNATAVGLAPSKTYPLSTIFTNTYNSGTERVYYWGYLAVRFMMENHASDIETLINLTRSGDYTAYLTAVDNISSSYDSQWSTWLDNVDVNQSAISAVINDISEDPTDPTDPPPSCEYPAQTGNYVSLQIEETVCIGGSNTQSFYVYVPSDNTTLYISTQGGSSDISLYTNTSTWATAANATHSSTNTGNEELVTVNANTGYVYINVSASSNFEAVALTVSTTAPDNTPPPPPPPTGEMCDSNIETGDYINVTAGAEVCISASDKQHFYYYVSADNTTITISTAKGQGNIDLLLNTSTWATQANAEYSATKASNQESITLTVNTGYLYITTQGNPDYQKVGLTVTQH